MRSLTRRSRVPGYVILAVLLVTAGITGAVTVNVLDAENVVPASGTAQNPAYLSIDSSDVTYSGLDATTVDVTVNNTDTVDHTVDVYVALKDSTGTVQSSGSVGGQVVTAGSTATVSVTMTSPVYVGNFAEIEVLVEETA